VGPNASSQSGGQGMLQSQPNGQMQDSNMVSNSQMQDSSMGSSQMQNGNMAYSSQDATANGIASA